MSKKKKTTPAAAVPVPANRKLQHMGYTIVQSTRNHHVMIGRDGRVVYHASCIAPCTDEELRRMVEDYHRRSR